MVRYTMLVSAGLLAVTAAQAAEGDAAAAAWRKIAPFFRRPERFAADYGDYKSPLVFDDGRKVRNAADWRKRRAEILEAWHREMGAWPPVLDKPAMEVLQTKARDGFTQKKVRVQIAADRRADAYLLVPSGKGPFPAVLVVYYDAEAGAGLNPKTKLRDFGYQLTRRGFVSLSLGWPRDYTDGGGATVQPLSRLAYVAANCRNALANLPEVDGRRIGVVGHSFGGKWAMFAACLDEKFACGAWSDPGIVFDEKRANVNYWERWYLGAEAGRRRKPGIPSKANPRTGAYKRLVAAGRDLHELHALMAPRPFLVSGGAEDQPERWRALNHAVAVNRLLGYEDRVGMTNRKGHSPTVESNEQLYAFFECFLKYGGARVFAKPQAGGRARMAFPGAKWLEATPRSQGVDASKLEAAVAYLKKSSGRDGVGELAIVRNGALIWKGDKIDKVHGVWSLTKSFTSTVLGLLIADGKCTLATLAKGHLPAMAGRYPKVTLRHFTTMTSGYYAVGDEPRGSYAHGPSTTPFRPGETPLFAPGTKYAYWDSAMNQFANVLTRIAGEPIEELFRRRIAGPIGMARRKWGWGDFGKVDGIVVNGGSGNNGKHLRISARELARFGLLFLNRGRWKGRQLVPASWVDAATSPQVPATTPLGHASSADGRGVYGYNWWANGLGADGKRKWPGATKGTCAASGYNNNDLFVIPEWHMVIVRLGLDQSDARITDAVYSTFLSKVGEAVAAGRRAGDD
jgi:CubicO group peptidase (beta-lactamase class C family)